jgi:hypothetical protein
MSAVQQKTSKRSTNLRKGAQDMKRRRRVYEKVKSAVQQKWPKASDKRRRNLLAKAKNVEKPRAELPCDPRPHYPSQEALRTFEDNGG